MRLSKALNEKVMDVRLRDKLISQGSLSKSDVENYLAQLPDDENKLEYTDIANKRREDFDSSIEQ